MVWISQLLVIMGVGFLPDRLWLLFYQRWEILGQRFVLNKGQVLLFYLQELESGFSESTITLPRYKFYTDLILKLLDYGRRFGAPIKKLLREIRSGLARDERFDRKLGREFWGGIIQLCLITFITWLFIYMSVLLVKAPLNYLFLFLIILLQLSGFIFYISFFKWWRHKLFAPLSHYFGSLYILRSLSEVGVAMRSCLAEAAIDQLLQRDVKLLKYVNKHLRQVVNDWQKKGSPIRQELAELVEELWFLQEQQFVAFNKRLVALKFSILICFFLSAYFLYLFSLFDLFMI